MQSLDKILGDRLQARDGEIGRVKDFYFEDLNWNVRYVIVDTGNWLIGRQVLLSPAVVSPGGDDDIMQVDLTCEAIENSPHIDEHLPVSRQHETELALYYQWPYYWAAPTGLLGAQPPLQTDVAEPADGPGEDPEGTHLRSVKELLGYRVQAADDEAGYVEDVVADLTSWMIRLLVVENRRLLPSKRFLVDASDVTSIAWAVSEITIRLPNAKLTEFDPEQGLPADD